jgi:membrane-bound lytic murein transglycosylase D
MPLDWEEFSQETKHVINRKTWIVLPLAQLLAACVTATQAPDPSANADLNLRIFARPPSPSPSPAPAPAPVVSESKETVRVADSNTVLVYNNAGPALNNIYDDDEDEKKEEVDVDELNKEQTTEGDVIDEDSELSPETLGELIPKEGPVEQTFALCEDSVFLRQWERDFDSKWIAENGKRHRKAKDRTRALTAARHAAFVSLVFPSIGVVDSDYPVVINKDVLVWLEYFQTRGRKAMVTWLKRGEDVIPAAAPVLEKNGLPRDLVYLSMIESGFNNRALSIAAAVGPWQFIRSTGKIYGLRIDDFVDERRDPAKATDAAARFLSDLYAEFGDWHLAAASYNAGPGRIRSAKRRSANDDFFSLSKANLLPNETRNYVPKLIAALLIGKYPGKFGFEVAQGSRIISSTSVKVTKPIELATLARASNVDPKLLETLNPELRHGITPPPTASRPVYELRVPELAAERITSQLASIEEATLVRLVSGRVNRKDSAGNFAARIGIPLAEFLRANSRVTAKTSLAKGQTVFIPVKLGSGQYDKFTSSQSKKSKSKSYKKSKSSKQRKSRR